MKNVAAVIYLLSSFGFAQVVFVGVAMYFRLFLEDGLMEWTMAGIIAVGCAVVFLVGAMECGRKLANRSLR